MSDQPSPAAARAAEIINAATDEDSRAHFIKDDAAIIERETRISEARSLIERLADVADDCCDDGPSGMGWKSPELRALLAEARAFLEGSTSPEAR